MAKNEKNNRPENKTYTAKVKNVQNNFQDNQLDLYLDINVPKIKPNGEASESNRVSKKLGALVDQLCECGCSPIKRMRRRALGKSLNPVLLAIMLEDSTITLEASYHFKGEQRQFEGATKDDTYTSDCWVYNIVKWEKELTNEDKEEFEEVRREEPFLVSTTAKTTAFDWYK